jgi:hypothetical protein
MACRARPLGHRVDRARHAGALDARTLVAHASQGPGRARRPRAARHAAVPRRRRRGVGAALPARAGRGAAAADRPPAYGPADASEPRLVVADTGRAARRGVAADGRHAVPLDGARRRPRARHCRRAGRADRAQPRPPRARADVGRARHPAGGRLPARSHRRRAVGAARAAQRGAPVVAAPVVRRARLPLLDAGPVRPPLHLPRRRARLRRDGARPHPQRAPAGRRGVGRVAGGHRADHRCHRDARGRRCQLARAAAGVAARRAAPADAVLPWRPRFHRVPGRLAARPAGRPAARGRRSGVGCRPARQGIEPVPRDGRQRLRVSQAVRADRRRAMAAARACLRDARHRAGRSRCRAGWPPALFAVDRRPRPRDLPVGLPARRAREVRVPHAGCLRRAAACGRVSRLQSPARHELACCLSGLLLCVLCASVASV